MPLDFQAAIFDFDGLLVNSEDIFDKVFFKYQEHLIKKGHLEAVLPDDVFLNMRVSMLGHKKEESAEILYKTLGINKSDLPAEDNWLIWRAPMLNEMFPQVELMPGADELTKKLHDLNIPMAIASGSSQDDLATKCQNHQELLSRFQVVVGGNQVDHGKPAPDIFLKAAEDLKVPIRECVVFEDAFNGVEAGLAAGAQQIVAVPTSFAPKDPFLEAQTQNPDKLIVLESLEEFSI